MAKDDENETFTLFKCKSVCPYHLKRHLILHFFAFLDISVNSPGSYVCNCISGYIKNSAGDCVDVNECLQTNPAVCKQTTEVCLNNEGGYECLCAKGYSDNDPSGAVLSCVDINECVANVTNATNVCGNNSDCTNIPGNYTCRCKRGK
jgi:hypothetical protein